LLTSGVVIFRVPAAEEHSVLLADPQGLFGGGFPGKGAACQWMLCAFKDPGPILVLGHDDFKPTLLTGDMCIGVVPTLPEAGEAACRLVEHLGRNWIRRLHGQDHQ
jgi:hypothetical protein